MQICWSDIERRPGIIEIDMLLSKVLEMYPNSVHKEEKSLLTSSDDFDKKWEVLSPNSTPNLDVHSDSVLLGMGEDYNVNTSKLLSPSLNNLHGSLDNLLGKSHFSLDDSIENNWDSISASECFIEGRSLSNYYKDIKSISSGSETEEENWKEKVENGTYTEKVRVKSKSITDLMVLTHIDYCESESETPFSSINYRVNYKTSRTGSSKSDCPYMSFGSESNLLNIQNNITKVNEELKKFHEEYSCSQLMPDRCTSESKIIPQNNYSFETENYILNDNASRFYEMNVQPQVFNLFNVTIDNLPYVNNKLNNYITYTNLSENVILNKERNYYSEVCANSQLSNSDDRLCDNSVSTSVDSILGAKHESHLCKDNCIHVGIENNQNNNIVKSEEDVAENHFNPINNILLHNDEEFDGVLKDESLSKSQGNIFIHMEHISVKEKSQVMNLEENSNKIIDLNNEISLRCNSSFIPFILYKNVPLKIKLLNFSSITLFNITIDPFDKKYGGHLMHWKTFLLKTELIKEELNIGSKSGLKSILIHTQINRVICKMPKLLSNYSSETEMNNVGLENSVPHNEGNENLDYSLETWDNFLEKAFNKQKEQDDRFYYEYKSMIFPNEDFFSSVNYIEPCMSTTCKSVVKNDDEKQDSLDDKDIDNEESVILSKETSVEKCYEGENTVKVL